jgi:hypothetical protein
MKRKLLLSLALLLFVALSFAQKRLTIKDANTGSEVQRIDFTKVFSYKIKNSDTWRNGFVTEILKDSVRLNNGFLALKNFDVIKQNKKAAPFINTTADVCLYTGLSAVSLSLLFYIIEKQHNDDVQYNGGTKTNYGLTKGTLITGAALGIIGGTLKLLNKKKSIQLGGQFTLVIK